MIIKTNLNDQGCPVVVNSFQDLLKKMMELNAEVVSMTVSIASSPKAHSLTMSRNDIERLIDDSKNINQDKSQWTFKERNVKVYTAPTPDGKTAMIRLQGKWIKDAGFNIGDRIKVNVEYGRLIIERL